MVTTIKTKIEEGRVRFARYLERKKTLEDKNEDYIKQNMGIKE